METVWINAFQKAPPCTDELIIAQIEGQQYQVGTGAMLHELFHLIWSKKYTVDSRWRWTPYSDELWEELRTK